MKRSTLNFWLDLMLFLVMAMLILTGLILEFVLPAGSGGRGGQAKLELWGMGRHDVGEIHFYLGLGLIVGLLLHVILHWSWVSGTLSRLIRGKAGPGKGSMMAAGNISIAFVAIILGVGTGLFYLARISIARVEDGRGRQEHSACVQSGRGELRDDYRQVAIIDAFRISGRTTLAQIAEAMEIDVDMLITQLSLPQNVHPDERVGRLCRELDTSVSQFRADVERLWQRGKKGLWETRRSPLEGRQGPCFATELTLPE